MHPRTAMALAELTRSLWAMFPASAASRYTPSLHVSAGFEIRTDPKTYYWDGLKRSADPLHPSLLLQYTLDGAGVYEASSGPALKRHDVPPAHAFLALLPSDHRYYLPPPPAAHSSTRWQFFWIILHHPYVVARLQDRLKTMPPVFSLDPESLLVARLLALLEGLTLRPFHDPFAEEQAIFDFLIELERFAYHLAHPASEQAALLEEVRAYVLDHLTEAITVEELARGRGMSRSHFTHYFSSRTGQTPAAFITDLRLAEARRQLLCTSDTLYAIAKNTGFADANHLCKIFRRKYHLTPNTFRKQLR